MQMQPPYDPLLAYRKAVEARFPAAVLDMLLFGSRARGDFTTESDFDVAVVVDADTQAKRRLIGKALSNIAYEFVLDGMPIRPIAIDRAFLASASPLAAEIARDGVRIG